MSIARASAIMIVTLVASRVLGWLRLSVIGAHFGETPELDAFWAAFKIPDAIFGLLKRFGMMYDKSIEDEQEKEEQQKAAGEFKDLVEHVKTVLGEKVKDVRTTTRLTSSPACLVVDEYGIDPGLERLLKAAGQTVPTSKPIMEINPHHPIILKMKDEIDEQRFSDWSWILFDQSILSLGEQLENPVKFVNRLNDLLTQL